LTAVADISKNALERAKRLGVKNTYYDYNELLNQPSIDAVVIALPTYLHAQSVKAAAEQHKHILLEKPIARSVSEGREILDTVIKYDVKLAIGYPLRFSSPFQDLKTKMERGELGEIPIAYATNIGTGPFAHRADTGAPVPVPEWWWNKELTGGGALLDLGSHMVNVTRWFFGDVVEAKSYLGYRLNMDQEDHAVCILKFNQGPIVIISVGWFSQKFQVEMEVFGTAGTATTFKKPQSTIKAAIRLMLRKPSSFTIPFAREIQNFVDFVIDNGRPQTSGEDAVRDLEVIERAYANQESLT